jgi:hypothetical protein
MPIASITARWTRAWTRRRKRFCWRRSAALAGAALLSGTAVWPQAAARALPPPPPAAAIEARVIAAFESDQKALSHFQYLEHVVTTRDGKVDARTLRVWYVNGNAVNRTVAFDSHALTPAEEAAEARGAAIRARAAARRPPPPQGEVVFDGVHYPFRRLAQDYVYGDGVARRWRGRTIWVYQARPNPAADARSRAESLLLHTQGEVWIDARDLHVVRLAVHSTSPVRYLLGMLATIHHAELSLEMQRYAPGVWLPAKADFSMNATILMFDRIVRGKRQSFRDFTETSAAR